MKRLILILFFLQISCASFLPADFIEPELLPYYEMFIKEANKMSYQLPIRDMTINFGILSDPKWAGYCKKYYEPGYGMQYQIIISSDYWPIMNEFHKIGIMFHELGHCWLDRGHSTEHSLMRETIPYQWENDYQYYVEELFYGN